MNKYKKKSPNRVDQSQIPAADAPVLSEQVSIAPTARKNVKNTGPASRSSKKQSGFVSGSTTIDFSDDIQLSDYLIAK